MLNKLIFIFLFLFSSAFAQEGGDIFLYKDQTYVFPHDAYLAISLDEELVKVEISNSKAYITSLTNSTARVIVQIYQIDGRVENVVVSSLRQEAKLRSSQSSYDKHGGYSFYFRAYYSENTRSEEPRYGTSTRFMTRVGEKGKFQLEYGTVKDRNDSYYFRYNYGNYYVAYGDRKLLTNELTPSFIYGRMLRQFQTGYSDGTFSLDLWTGNSDPLYYGERISDYMGSRSSYGNRYDDNFSGLRTSYLFGKNKKDAVFASYWINPRADTGIPYAGLRLNFLDETLIWRTTLGGTNERMVSVNEVGYKKKKKNQDFGLQRVSVSHSYAENGYDSLLEFTNNIEEHFNVKMDFYSIGYRNNEGSIVISPSFSYDVEGYNESERYGVDAGWQAAKTKIGYVYDEVNVDSTISIDYKTIMRSPYISYSIKEEKESKWLIDFKLKEYETKGLSYDFLKKDYVLGLRKSSPFFGYGVNLNRAYSENMTSEAESFGINPFLNYGIGRFSLRASHTVNFTNTQTQFDPSYDLSSEMSTVDMKYRFKDYHQIQGKYTRVANNFAYNRDYDYFLISYSFAYMNRRDPIFSFLKSSNIKGIVFEDINRNGVFDKGDIPFSNIVVEARNDKDSVKASTNMNGEFILKNLKQEKYDLIIDHTNLPEGYVLNTYQQSLDLTTNRDISMNITASLNNEIKVEIKGNDGVVVPLVMRCYEEQNIFTLLTNSPLTLKVPKKGNCSLRVDVASVEGGAVLDVNDLIVLDDVKEYVFDLKTSQNFQIISFNDLNKNKIFDIGEELGGVRIETNQGLFITEKGFLTTNKINAKNLNIRKIERNGYHCHPANNQNDIKRTNSLIILCNKR